MTVHPDHLKKPARIGAPSDFPDSLLCPKCFGDGEVLVPLLHGTEPYDYAPCPRCHGTGVAR